MNEFDERQRKRRNYEREQEELLLIAQEKERIIKKVWFNFSILSLLVWILYGSLVSSLKAEYINLVVIITLSVQVVLFTKAVLKRNKLRKQKYITARLSLRLLGFGYQIYTILVRNLIIANTFSLIVLSKEQSYSFQSFKQVLIFFKQSSNLNYRVMRTILIITLNIKVMRLISF